METKTKPRSRQPKQVSGKSRIDVHSSVKETKNRSRPGTSRSTRDSVRFIDISDSLGRLLLKPTTLRSQVLALESDDEEEKKPARNISELLKDPDALKALRMLKGVVFKADVPYRTRLGLFETSMATSAAGLLNYLSATVNAIGSVAEWGSIDALFDEFFVHSMTIHFAPFNNLGGGVGTGPTTSTYPTGGSVLTSAANAGCVMVSLFNGGGFYTSCAAMLNNPTRALSHTSKSWKYVWRNNVKFEKHGLALVTGTGLAWQGWTAISAVSNYGGAVQVRTFNDKVLGGGSQVETLGDVAVIWDVSFRARA